MVLFFVIAGLMVVAVVTLVVFPLVRRHSTSTDQRDRQNIVIAQERLSELGALLEAGLISEPQAVQERSDIERALLDDVDSNAQVQGPVAGKYQGTWVSIAVAVSVPFVAGTLYLLLGQPTALDSNRINMARQGSDHSDVDVATMVRNLEQRLATSPNEIEGWYVLGNSYMTLKQFDKAAAVFQKLRALVGDEPDLLVRQADALAMKNGGLLSGEPERLILEALEMKPDHSVALWLAGIAARRRGDIEGALSYWRRAQPLFAKDSKSQAELQGLIDQATQLLEEGDSPAGITVANTDKHEQNKGTVNVVISLDDSLKDQVLDGDTLFVLARALDGPPIPLAVVRRQARDLPLTLSLDDHMAMVPEMNLSKYDQVEVVAKISKSGEPKTQSGDFIGQVSPVSPGQDALIKLVISDKVP